MVNKKNMILDRKKSLYLILVLISYPFFVVNPLIGLFEILIGIGGLFVFRKLSMSENLIITSLLALPYSSYLYLTKSSLMRMILDEYNNIFQLKQENIESVLKVMVDLLPAFHYITFTIFLLIIVKIFGKSIANYKNIIKEFRIPFNLIWILILGLLMLLFKRQSVIVIGSNIALGTLIWYVFEGFLISEVFLNNLKVNKTMRVIIYVFAFISFHPLLLILLALLGILNQWKNIKLGLINKELKQ